MYTALYSIQQLVDQLDRHLGGREKHRSELKFSKKHLRRLVHLHRSV
jgi:hypothetical protein